MSLIKNLSVDPKKLFDYFIKSKGVKEVVFFGPYYLNPTDKPKRTSSEVVFSQYERDKNRVLASKRNIAAMVSVNLMAQIDEFDELLFVGGDGDFLHMLKKMQSKKKIVHVCIYGDIFNQN